MLASANMSLTLWDQSGDGFSHAQLLTNLQTIDAHDHTTGKGVPITTAAIAPGAITPALIQAGAVTQAAIAANAVGAAQIQPGAVGSSEIAAGAVLGASLAAGAVNWTQLDPNVIPLGTVAMWWRASGSNNTPGGGWEIMDGRPWSSITNSLGLTTGNIPDMRGVFPMGADITGGVAPGIGATGGSNTANLTHVHTVLSHVHTITPHTHPITTDGQHWHTWLGGLSVWSRQNEFPIGTTIIGIEGNQHSNTYYGMYLKNIQNTYFAASNPWLTDGNSDMDQAGAHSHGGATQGNGPVNTGATTATTDAQLGTVSTVPKYEALLFIMRVR